LPGVVESDIGTTARLKRNAYQFLARTAEWVKGSNHQLVLILRRSPKYTQVGGFICAPKLYESMGVKYLLRNAAPQVNSINGHLMRAARLTLQKDPGSIGTQPSHIEIRVTSGCYGLRGTALIQGLPIY
jgi:hypothetical protein